MSSRPASRLFLSFLLLLAATPFASTAPRPPSLVYPLQLQRPPVARVNHTWTWTLLDGTFNTSSGTTLSLSTRSLPTWASFDASSYTFSGMPAVGDEGSHYVTVQANASGVAQGNSDGFSLLVVDGDGPTVRLSLAQQLPTASSLGDGAIYTADGALRVPPTWSFSLGFQQYTFQDASYARIYYTAYQTGTTELPSWLIFDNRTVTFDGVAPTTLGEVSITVFGSDHFGYGDLQETIKLSIGYHSLEVVGVLPAINATSMGAVNYTVPLANLRIDNSSITNANLSSVTVDLAQASFLSFDPTTRILAGTVPASFTPGLVALPITFMDQYNDTVATNVSLVVSPSPTSSSIVSVGSSSSSSVGGAVPTSSSAAAVHHSGLSHSAKLAIGLTLGILGGFVLLALLMACCRRYSSDDERRMRRNGSTLIFDQATIAAAQQSTAVSNEKTTSGQATGAGKSAFASPYLGGGGRGAAKEGSGRKSLAGGGGAERDAAVAAAVAGAAVAASSSKPKRLNLMGIFGKAGGSTRPDVSTISLPVPQSNSLYGLGIGDAPPAHHNIVVVTDGNGGTYVPRETAAGVGARAAAAADESDLSHSSSWESGGSSSLFYSEGSENEASRQRVRKPPRPDPTVPRQRRDFLPLPVRGTPPPGPSLSSPSRDRPRNPSPPSTPSTSTASGSGSGASSGGSSSSDPRGGIRIVHSDSLSTTDGSVGSLRPYSSVAAPAPRLMPFMNERMASLATADPHRRPSHTARRSSSGSSSAHEDADEDADEGEGGAAGHEGGGGAGGRRGRRRSQVYLPPEAEGSPTTSAVFFATPRETTTSDGWGRSPSVSEYGGGGGSEGVRLVSSVSGSPDLGRWDPRHASSSVGHGSEHEDEGELRVITY